MNDNIMLNEESAKKTIENSLKSMRPGQVMTVVARQLGMTSSEFMKEKLFQVIVDAVKSGKVKAGSLISSLKEFN